MIFISYTRADSEFAGWLSSRLKERGVNVWMDQQDIPAGVHWDRAVEEALVRAGSLLVLLTPNSVKSHNVMDEVAFALEEGKVVIPILVQSCTIPFRLRRLQYVDFTKGDENALAQLLYGLPSAAPSAPDSSLVEDPSQTSGEGGEPQAESDSACQLVVVGSNSVSEGSKSKEGIARVGSSEERAANQASDSRALLLGLLLAGMILSSFVLLIAAGVYVEDKEYRAAFGFAFGALFVGLLTPILFKGLSRALNLGRK